MTSYRVAPGWGNLAGLTELTIQPAQPLGLAWPDEVMSLAGSQVYQGYPQTELVWNNLLAPADRETLLAEFGLNTSLSGALVASVQVTVRLLDNSGAWMDVNAWAHAPNGGARTMLGWRDFRIALTYLHRVNPTVAVLGASTLDVGQLLTVTVS